MQFLIESCVKGAVVTIAGIVVFALFSIIEKTISLKHKQPLQSKGEDSKTIEDNEITANENELYEQIWQEIEENKTDIGLWANCFSSCKGDENKTKALYVNKRVLILKENLKNELIDQEKKRKKESKKEIAERFF